MTYFNSSETLPFAKHDLDIKFNYLIFFFSENHFQLSEEASFLSFLPPQQIRPTFHSV